MSNFYTFLKGIMATLLLLVAPSMAVAQDALPEGLAGNYTYKVSELSVSDLDVDVSGYEKTYTGEISVDASGKVLMTGLINTPVVYEMVDGTVSQVKKAYEGTYDATASTITFTQPEGSSVTCLADYSSWCAKPFTVKVQKTVGGHYVLSADEVVYTDADGAGVKLTLAGVKMYSEGSEGEALPAPADLAGKYQVSLGTPTFTAAEDAEGAEAPAMPTTYKAAVKVSEDGQVTMTGLVGTPVVADDDPFGLGTVASSYVGAYDDAAQTITFSMPDGASIVDEAAGNIYTLKAPFTLKISRDENDHYVFSTTSPVEFTCAGTNNGTVSYADATFNVMETHTIAKADLVGEWKMAYKGLNPESGEEEDQEATITIGEEDGDLYFTNFLGSDAKFPVTYAEDGLTMEVVADEDGGNFITGDLTMQSAKAMTYAFQADGSMVLETPIAAVFGNSREVYVMANATLTKVVVKPDPVYTAAPADMAGNYVIKIASSTNDDSSYMFETKVDDKYRATITIGEDGSAQLKGLIGKFTHSEIDYEKEEEIVTETPFVGKYDSANSEITFTLPDGYKYRDDYDYNWTLSAPFTVKVEKNEENQYVMTAEDNVVFKAEYVEAGYFDPVNVTLSGVTFTQKATYHMDEADLIGKWQLKYTYYDEEETVNFEIAKNEDGKLVLANFNGDDYEHAIKLSEGGFSVAGLYEYDSSNRFSRWFSGKEQGIGDVEFEFTADKTLALASILKWSTPDHKKASVVPEGTVAVHPAKEHQPAAAPADLAGVYVMNIPTFTTVGSDDDYSNVGHSFRGTITVDADGKAQLSGLLGKFTKSVYDSELDDYVEADTTFAGQYDAAYETITFTLNDGFRFGDNQNYRYWTPVAPFTVKVTKGEDGLYTLTQEGDMSFKLVDYDGFNETVTVNLEGVTFTQQKIYEANLADMVGKWQFAYEANGESKTVDFEIEKLGDEYTITNFDGDEDYTYDIVPTMGGFKVAGIYEYDGFARYFKGVEGYDTKDVEFAFTDHNTFSLITLLYWNSDAHRTPSTIPAGTEAVHPAAKLGEAITSLDQIDPTKTYALYNPVHQVYAVYDEAHGDNIWAANVPGQDKFNDVAVDFDAASANCSWQIVKKGDKIMIYNVGAKKFLATPRVTGGGGSASMFEADVTDLVVEELGDGKFAFSTTGNKYDYFCSAKQFAERPMTNWSSDDNGSGWMFVENPNVAADADAAGLMTGLNTVVSAPAQQGIYTTSGVKLNATDVRKLQKGLYIVNGKKVLVK